jgi:hypothetical protein
MSDHPRRSLLLSLILLISFIAGAEGAFAETAFSAVLSVPDASDFPHVTAYLDVHDPTGSFVHGLSTADVTMQENDIQTPISELQEQKPGVQFIIAITPGDTFTIRDSQGTSRYEYLLQGILAGTWMDQPTGVDDLSLLTMGGPQLVHSTDPKLLQSSLETYKPGDPNTGPNLEVLAAALQLASDTTTRPGMERAILFITPPQPEEVSLGLQSIIASAVQQNIHIYVWTVASQEVFDLPEIEQLRKMAEETKSSFFAFSRDESVPDLENIIEPLRYIYQLGYDSQITTSGTQQVLAQVMVGSEQVLTEPQSFELALQAPAPVFLGVPADITRTYSSLPTPGVTTLDGDLSPSQQVINIQVTFPDGYDRSLTRTSLYVDGAIVSENTEPPFDQLIWDLRPYTQEGVHLLSVEAVDNLGILGKTEDKSVRIILPKATQGVMVEFSQKRFLVIGVIVLISASILALVLILGGRIHPKPYPGQVSHPARYRARMLQRKDTVVQPANISSNPQFHTNMGSKSWKGRLPWLKRKVEAMPVIAYLIPMVGSDEPTLPEPLRIMADDVTLGSDSLRANLVISDRSIEGIHARIRHEGKSFVITDTGSVAGTWVNYQPVPTAGTLLEHADIIHLGGVVLRFNLAEPGQPRKILVTPMEPDR